MGTLNTFQICGTCKTVEAATSNAGTQYSRLSLEVDAFRQGAKVLNVFEFAFFHEQAEVLQSQVFPGDLVLVSGKLDKNRNGYLDIRATSFAVVRKAPQAQQEQRVDPADLPPVQRRPQYAARQAPAMPQDATPREMDAIF